MQSTDKHVPVFVISLKDAEYRRELMTRQLNHLGIAFEFIDAVDGRESSGENLDHYAVDRPIRIDGRSKMSNTEIACALSHRSAYQTIIDRGLSEAVILEDDVYLEEEFASLCCGNLEKDYDIILLDHRNATIKKWFQKTDRNGKFTFHKTSRIPWIRYPRMADAYRLTLEMAQVLVDASTPIRTVADWPVLLRRYNTKFCMPRAVLHTDAKSRQRQMKSFIYYDRQNISRLNGRKKLESLSRSANKFRYYLIRRFAIELRGEKYKMLVEGKGVRYLQDY